MRIGGKWVLLLTTVSLLWMCLWPLGALSTASEQTPPPPPSAQEPSEEQPPIEGEVFRILHSDGETVSSMAVREFLIWTVAAEMPAAFELEALKAQAVAAYTFFCYERAAERAAPSEALRGADFSDTPVSYPEGYTAAYWQQRLGDAYDASVERIAAAVDAVAGKRILYDDAPIFAAYHAISGGTTEVPEVVWSAAFPYLQSVASPLDEGAPDFATEVRLTAPQLAEAMADVEGIDLSGDAGVWIADDAVRSAAGTVVSQTVGGVSLGGREWRSRCGLRSSCFTVTYADGEFCFAVKGYGHGVGMSQYGAQFLAQSGYTWEEILHHYYTGVEIR